MNSIEKVTMLESWMDEKNISDIVVIDVRDVNTETDYFIIGTALNERNARAICDHLEEKSEQNDFKPIGKEGYDTGKWILIDYSDVCVNLFTQSEREIYNLEKLWNNGKFLSMRQHIKEEINE